VNVKDRERCDIRRGERWNVKKGEVRFAKQRERDGIVKKGER